MAQGALVRAERVFPALNGARILWVDGNPTDNTIEREIFEDIGMKFQLALNTDSALQLMEAETPDKFDLVISTVFRKEDHKPILLSKCPAVFFSLPSSQQASGYHYDNLAQLNESLAATPPAGFPMAESFAEHFPKTFGYNKIQRIIFYTGANDGISANACARLVTNRPDVLLQRVVSALAEFRWPELLRARYETFALASDRSEVDASLFGYRAPAPPLPHVFGPSVCFNLPLAIGDCIGTAAGEGARRDLSDNQDKHRSSGRSRGMDTRAGTRV